MSIMVSLLTLDNSLQEEEEVIMLFISPQLKVREHPVLGPYVEGLSTYGVNSFDDVEVNV